jgi:sugar phosphate isomerase/epimerase
MVIHDAAQGKGRRMTPGLSINLATIRQQCTLPQAIEVCLRNGVGGIAPWRDQVHAVGLAEAARIVRASGLTVTGLCRGGMFPAATPEKRRENIEDNLRAVEEAAALGADCLVLVVGGLPEGSRDIAGARAMVAEGIAAILPEARAAGIPLAIEPLHPMYAADRACVNTLRHALDLCDIHGEGIGVAVDAYHVWWDPELATQMARAGDRVLAHHICDWLVPTKDMLLDRGMMGDGVIDLKGIRRMVENAGFHGLQEVEIFSAETWWKRDPDEVVRTCIERYNAVCCP